jgi:hypothetical protein
VPTPVTGARPLSNPATTLAATRLTPDVGGRGRTLVGRVRSVHRAAIYIDRPAPHGLLVVAIDDVGGVPGGILVGRVGDLRATGIRPGMTVLPSPNGFAIPSATIDIDLTRAAIWSPTLPAAARFRPAGELGPVVAAARRLAADLAPVGGLAPLLSDGAGNGDPWLVRAGVLVRAQLEALGTGDVAAAVGPTIDLIGLGVGLTPSGDDYLVGVLAGLDATGHPARPDLAAAIAAQAPDRTTAVGAATLRHAAAGAFSERLHAVLIALAGGRLDGVAAAIGRATAYGATSGSDTLVGVFAALDLEAARWARMPGVAA